MSSFDEICDRHGLTHEALNEARKRHRESGCDKPSELRLIDRGSKAFVRCDGCGAETEVLKPTAS